MRGLENYINHAFEFDNRLHGGAFMQGSGARAEYNGIKLAQRGIVVVTLNYRLGKHLFALWIYVF